jgi:hypothetical protein
VGDRFLDLQARIRDVVQAFDAVALQAPAEQAGDWCRRVGWELVPVGFFLHDREEDVGVCVTLE